MTAASELMGRKLDGDWEVIEALTRPPAATGGYFSHGYIVRHPSGQRGFLKALDFTAALQGPDPARDLQFMAEAYNFERAILFSCRQKRLDRVVTAIADGKIDVGPPYSPSVVQYIIFELADGDIRKHAIAAGSFSLAWQLRSLHHIATGLSQLHGHGIAHQDLKPSNVLVFEGSTSKLSDLGRAVAKTIPVSHDSLPVAGDRGYAPPELLYNHVDPEWNRRRFGCDMYLLGSMIVFFATGVPATALLRSHLSDDHSWERWNGTYVDVLPYLHSAFADVVEDVAAAAPAHIATEFATFVSQLCEPDYRLRGHPRNRMPGDNQYSLERYLATFDLLATRERGRV